MKHEVISTLGRMIYNDLLVGVTGDTAIAAQATSPDPLCLLQTILYGLEIQVTSKLD
jgi:hypothetical protein